MKVTDEMIDAFGNSVWAHPWTDAGQTELSRSEVRDALQAVFDLIELRRMRSMYRSILPDGSVWCESSDPADFPNTPPNSGPLHYQKLNEYAVTDDWQEWTP